MATVQQTGDYPNDDRMELDELRMHGTPEYAPTPGPRDAITIPSHPRGIRLILITAGLILSIFLSALDSTIIATAIPSITTEFGSISNIAWYGSSYIITNAAFQSCWGKAYTYFPLKITFLMSILVFEIGNVICALAPRSELLIFGRTLAGMGGGGIMTGAFIIIALTAGPKYRAAYMGILGVTFGLASVVGPLMGGALTDGPGWRSFFGFASLLVCFVMNEWMMGKKAMVQFHLFENRTILANSCFIFFLAGAYFPLLYTLPIQFQSVNNTSASQSGIRLIPLVLGISAVTMIANGVLTFWRHFKPFLLVGAVFAITGNVKIYRSDTSTLTSEWVGYEILSAIGIGIALQIPMIANQASVPTGDLAAATSLTLFMENCGTALFVASSEAAFTTGLLASLDRNLPDIDTKAVLEAGATQIRSLFSGEELQHVLGSYLDGCKTSHIVTVVCGAIAGLISLSNAGPAAVTWAKLRMKKAHER
ncbi:hypothetical protein N0V94_003008 [Neodidymelliopsis sp. IMI 364377]|nr:hypothetical protein N0V94_003008 [Neodidymelliopsis sp. IMI 364377]